VVLFNVKPVKDIGEVKREVARIVGRQKPGSSDDLSAFKGEIEELMSLFCEFHPEWKKAPAIFRVVRVDAGGTRAYLESVVLPDIKHDLDLMLKMLNHMREQKGLQAVKMPLFVQPDEIALARKEGKTDIEGGKILSQFAIVFQKGAIMWVGFVFGRDYILLQG
jgi:hypothetical protein